MRYSFTIKLATLACSIMVLSTFAYAYPVAHATQANWQTAFSGTFNIKDKALTVEQPDSGAGAHSAEAPARLLHPAPTQTVK